MKGHSTERRGMCKTDAKTVPSREAPNMAKCYRAQQTPLVPERTFMATGRLCDLTKKKRRFLIGDSFLVYLELIRHSSLRLVSINSLMETL